MATVSFPVTFAISINVPDSFAPAIQQAIDRGEWKFTTAHDGSPNVSGPGSRVVTESSYTPAPKLPHESFQAAPEFEPTESQIAAAESAETTLDGQPITDIQSEAIRLLVRGTSVGKVAQALGVHPNTVHRWKRADARFRAVLNATRNDYQDAAHCRLESLSDQVVSVLSKEVANGNFRAALQVAKGLGLLTGKPREQAEERADQIEQVDIAQARAKAVETEAAYWLSAGPKTKSAAEVHGAIARRQAEELARRHEEQQNFNEQIIRLMEENQAAQAAGPLPDEEQARRIQHDAEEYALELAEMERKVQAKQERTTAP